MPDITSTPLEDHLARKKNTLTAAIGKGITAPAPGSTPPAPVATGIEAPAVSAGIAAVPQPAQATGASLTARIPATMAPAQGIMAPLARPATNQSFFPDVKLGPARAGGLPAITNQGITSTVATPPARGIEQPAPALGSTPAAPVAQAAPAASVGQSLTNHLPSMPGVDVAGIMKPLDTTKVGIESIGTAKDPFKKGFTGSGIVADQPANSSALVDGIISRQPVGIDKDALLKTIKTNALSGIMPDPQQVKDAGLNNADMVGILSGANKNGQFSKGIEAMQTQQVTDIAASKANAEMESAKQMGIANMDEKKATAEWHRAQAGALSSKGAGITGHVIQDPDSPTGWSYADQSGNIAATGAPDPSTKKMDMNKLSDEEQAAINKAVTEKRLDPYKVNSRNQKTLAGIEIAHPGTDLNSISGNLGVARNKDVIIKAGVADMLPGLVKNVVTVGKALNYSDTQFVGKVQQLAQGQLNDPRLVEYMTARNDLLLTLGGVMRGNGMTDMAQKLEEQAAHPTMSPKALDGWMKGQMASIDPRLKLYHSLISGKGLPGADATATDTPAHSPQAAPAGITGESPQRLGERVGKDLKRGASKEAAMHALMDLGYSDDVISQALKFAQGGK